MRISAITLALLGFAGHLTAQCSRTELTKVLMPGGHANAAAGYVAIQGDVAAVGSIRQGDVGAVDVFRMEEGVWLHEQKLQPSDLSRYDSFGRSVVVDGNRLAVSAPNQNDRGAVYIFRRSNGIWALEQKVLGSELSEGAFFGRSIALQGATLVAGAFLADHGSIEFGRGKAYVFKLEDGTWVERQVLVAPDPEGGDEFGWSVALDGDVAVVGARRDDHELFEWDRGSAFVYRLGGSEFEFEQVLMAGDAENDGLFGIEVAVSSGRILVSSWPDPARGAVYSFAHDGTRWIEEQKIESPEGMEVESFGLRVAVDSDRAIVSARGAASVPAFAYRLVESQWELEHVLEASDGRAGQEFGSSVALSGQRAWIGASGDDTLGDWAGAAYDFRLGTHRLEVDSDQVSPGETLTLYAIAGVPAKRAALFLTAINDVPSWFLLGTPVFSQEGTWEEGLAISNPLGEEFRMSLRSVSLEECDQLEESLSVEVVVTR